jgi:hypothetical protein
MGSPCTLTSAVSSPNMTRQWSTPQIRPSPRARCGHREIVGDGVLRRIRLTRKRFANGWGTEMRNTSHELQSAPDWRLIVSADGSKIASNARKDTLVSISHGTLYVERDPGTAMVGVPVAVIHELLR